MRKVIMVCDVCEVEESYKNDFLYTLPSGWSHVGLHFEYDLCRDCTAAARNAITDWIQQQ